MDKSDLMSGLPGLGASLKEEAPAEDSDLEMHAGSFARAVKSGDKKAIANAFRAMKQACDAEGYGDGDADDLDG